MQPQTIQNSPKELMQESEMFFFAYADSKKKKKKKLNFVKD